MKMSDMDIYLEIGQKKVIACALAWPGWCRSGKDEGAALTALLATAPRYATILAQAQVEFQPPKRLADLVVVEQLVGNSTTDYGVPNIAAAADQPSVTAGDVEHFQALLTAYWQALVQTVATAQGRALRKGPRGGGRDLDGIVQHLLHANDSYIRRLSFSHKTPSDVVADDVPHEAARTQQAIGEALAVALRGDLPARGPRGGAIWLPRYFVRRAGWHLLDHIWEIEDRLID